MDGPGGYTTRGGGGQARWADERVDGWGPHWEQMWEA